MRERAERAVVLTLRLARPLGPAAALVGALFESDTPATAVIEARFAVPVFRVRRFGRVERTVLVTAGGKLLFELLALLLRSLLFSALCALLAAGTFSAAGLVERKRTVRACPRVVLRGGAEMVLLAALAFAVTIEAGTTPVAVAAKAAMTASNQSDLMVCPPHRPRTAFAGS
ncbi:MAG: hypothetical protein AAGI28_01100 [Pseudomonadota bacterium]